MGNRRTFASWNKLFRNRQGRDENGHGLGMSLPGSASQPSKWSMGVLNDRRTNQVPGSVLLWAPDSNGPLDLDSIESQTSVSTFSADPAPSALGERGQHAHPVPAGPTPPDTGLTCPTHSQLASSSPDSATKTTADGRIILEPQPEDSANDPLNWPSWRRNTALLCLGFYCMVGGGMTPILAAGFTDIAEDYHVEVESIALTTGLFMLGMGIGSVVASPTAIIYGKRPVYLVGAIGFILSCVWSALSPGFASLIVARIVQGMTISPVECLPSATIAEIFFLHERAFRIGIYTLLLLGGKNLIPLVSAAVIQGLGWRWVFWIVGIVAGLGFALMFLFVPETFWDRKPLLGHKGPKVVYGDLPQLSPAMIARPKGRHNDLHTNDELESGIEKHQQTIGMDSNQNQKDTMETRTTSKTVPRQAKDISEDSTSDDLPADASRFHDVESETTSSKTGGAPSTYTSILRNGPPRSFKEQLRPFNGRLRNDSWLGVLIRPFILFLYPSILWSAAVYSCSVGWLIVISESMAMIYRDRELYNFDAFQTGLVYLSPFVGGILGSALAGKVSDMVVQTMARRNGGLYEPEFRLVMTVPVLLTTVAGLMGFGWSAQERDHWIVPTLFFGIVSFGCSMGSTTAITFCVDSYRQFAGEALVTLNFSKNVFHGLVFSLFTTHWISSDGPKTVFMWIGVIQLVLMLTSIPMFIYGKRARGWTARKQFITIL